MKKKAYLISNCILIILFVFLNNCYASTTGTVYLSSEKNKLEKGEEIEITLYIENVKTAAFTSYIYFDDLKLEYVSGPENTNVVNNQVIHVWYDSSGGNNPKEGELAMFKFRAKESGVATFNIEGEFYSSSGQLIQTNFKELQIQIGEEQTKLASEEEEHGTNLQSNIATLQSLRLNIEGITPNFQKDIHEYYLTIPNLINDIQVVAISENPNATIEITGNNNLKEGLNLITIKVTSEDKTQSNIYTIQLTKTDNIEAANTNLEILAIENILLYPPFDETLTHYNIEVSNETNNLNVFAVPKNENATVQITGNEGLKEGNNLITINVIAQNGFSKKLYEVNAYKRNQEEENKYKEEQENNKEKLEEIYKIKTNNELEETQENNETNIEEKRKHNFLFIIILIVVVLIVLIFIIYIVIQKLKKGKIF